MADGRSLKAKISMLKKGVSRLPNVSLTTMPVRQAVWQTYITRAGSDAAEAIERVARGQHLSSVLREFSTGVQQEVFQPLQRDLRWHFMRMG
jgi:hypothetical protein